MVMDVFYYKSPIGILEIIFENGELISLKSVETIHNSSDKSTLAQELKHQLDD